MELERWLNQRQGLERAAGSVQRALRKVLAPRRRLEGLLHGDFIGHPLHAALTDIPVGAWSMTLLLDILGSRRGGWRFHKAADTTCAVGLISALVAALPGAADYSKVKGTAKKVGLIHGLLNLGVSGLYAASVVARRRGARRSGVALSSTGYGIALLSAWLGGELSYRYGVGSSNGVRRAAGVPESGGSGDVESMLPHIGETGYLGPV